MSLENRFASWARCNRCGAEEALVVKRQRSKRTCCRTREVSGNLREWGPVLLTAAVNQNGARWKNSRGHGFVRGQSQPALVDWPVPTSYDHNWCLACSAHLTTLPPFVAVLGRYLICSNEMPLGFS